MKIAVNIDGITEKIKIQLERANLTKRSLGSARTNRFGHFRAFHVYYDQFRWKRQTKDLWNENCGEYRRNNRNIQNNT